MDILSKYINGNVTVTILEDGTKIREYEDVPNIIHPESIDVKITNYCDMNCLYCHESSTVRGKHGDLDQLLDVIKDLPSGVELAIGGGNPLSHPELIQFLSRLKQQGIIANLTVNQGHLKVYQELLIFLIQNDLVKGLGISIVNNNFKYVKPLLEITDNIVYHLIAGVNPFSIVDDLIKLGQCKVLILGYKVFGFGVDFYSKEVDLNIATWYKNIRSLLGKCTISFDNLAIEQLKIKRLFTDEGWERFYMGDDFCFTMYIDAVKQEYAPTSRSSERVSFNECSLIKYFERRNS